MSLTMSKAVRLTSLGLELFGGWKADHNTRWDLVSTRNTVPLPAPNVEFSAGDGTAAAGGVCGPAAWSVLGRSDVEGACRLAKVTGLAIESAWS
jgi:hypothetical protein